LWDLGRAGERFAVYFEIPPSPNKEKPWLYLSRVFKIASILNFNSGMSFSTTDQTASTSISK
jgi:hypothetical protein